MARPKSSGTITNEDGIITASLSTVYKHFGQLAPKWNSKLKTYTKTYGATKNNIPELGKIETCIINECVKNTYKSFTSNDVPFCFMCVKLSAHPCILAMAHYVEKIDKDGNMTKSPPLDQRIEDFYRNTVPLIESHFNSNHVQR